MSETLSEVLALLERLVACDTRNPPRAIDRGGIFAALGDALGPGFAVEIVDLGEGCVSMLATRGEPSLLFNVHVDTVPADPAWDRDPLALRVEGDRAVGLGACDIKGAAAALVVAARRTDGPAALLFTSDEEAGSSRCVRDFVARRRFARVVVAEPTRCRAVLEHRGIATCHAAFRGTGGHASSPRALADSALHEAVRWASRALAFAEESEARRYENLSGIRFNLGTMAGGTKANMIAAAAELRFGVRPLPDQRPRELLAAIAALAPNAVYDGAASGPKPRAGDAGASRATFTPGFVAPPLPAPGALADAIALARDLGLDRGAAVDFWTEAALFSESGAAAIVYGPGDIAQAHTAGEWVRTSELAEAEATYERLFSGR
jgi:acetylornithine deacetylase